MIGALKIGDGTAPKGWPAYGKHGFGSVRCNFNNCGHTGTLGSPAVMDCKGVNCDCSCCQFLSGKIVFGLSYGPRR